MIYREYGKTGKMVSAVGFGGMRFDISKSDEENAELLRYASSKGINYFDTAPNYCENRSEKIFGIAFKDMPNDFYVSTKGMPTQYDTKEKAKDAVKRSLEKLGVDKINFYHVWCLRKMSHYELAMKPGGQYEGLLECKEEGLIDHIVFSSHQPGHEVKEILQEGKFEGVLLGVNILNFPYRWDGVLSAYENGYGVVAMNPLAGGAIAKHEKELHFLSMHGETPTEAALRFNIASPQITVTLNGFTTKEQIDMACRIADKGTTFTEKDLEKIKKHLGENMNAVCTGCGYCWDCPMQIPVPAYMQFYNDKQMFGKSDEKLKKELKRIREWGFLAVRKGRAKGCVKCGKCEEACTQHLPIIKRLEEIAKWERSIER
ncbi:aldo/keto reductase [Crassaminicella indica]|uniref:Aldo/keto reductase n=2 Tax=Crassaminicella indica TaxID=2855394 RepID=A0ABX8RFX8_9CLOT|nr:aldo/keto reductase [Crassaminicella indica]